MTYMDTEKAAGVAAPTAPEMIQAPCNEPNREASLPRFTRDTLTEVLAMPHTAAESVAASVLNVSVAQLREWRKAGVGPEYETTVSGLTIYTRRALLRYVYRHMEEGRS
ncbi:hypothetical protein [Bifidobacterium scaligerum]|uniref:DNA-binding protein n=1 Tax=Bifidobacterium scaligerum TaxID=2052656 RepID=A0A2M9HQC7_9BIFI|nr:hypothetical protein [Bifidobacterium scaligerum]PJM79016.1 hypothetical protein CUU80_06665 [Bifidobacterium scaligerum]